MDPKIFAILLLGLVSAVSAASLVQVMEIDEFEEVEEYEEMPQSKQLNNKVTIGILTQESPKEYRHFGDEYIMSEYIKYIEMAGGSVVAIRGGKPDSYYQDQFNKINGFLMPGGATSLNASTYSRSSNILFQLAKEANDKGDFFPVWGTCQGFEMMSVMVAGKYVLDTVDAQDMSIPLRLLPNYKQSRLLGSAPADVIRILRTRPVTANFHTYCLTPKTFKANSNLNGFFRVMSLNKGRQGVEYISTMEAYKYPFYAIQWHPEKNIFSRNPTQHLNHSPNARRITQYMANFFVDEARKNYHTYPEEEKAALVVENDDRVYIKPKYIENFFYNLTKS